MSEGARLRLLSMAAVAVGATAAAIPAQVLSVAGTSASPAARWSLQLTGVRDLCLAAVLWRAAGTPDQRLRGTLRRIVTASQAGDVAVTAWLVWRRGLPRRMLSIVVAGGLATVALSGWPER